MKKKVLVCVAMLLALCLNGAAQDAKTQPLTFWYEYTIHPGQEARFLELVKTVGAPVRDKLMADGVVLAWGVNVPMLRAPGGHTHGIWYTVADWSGIEKVDNAMRAQIMKLDEEGMKGGPAKKGAASMSGPTAAIAEIADTSKTQDYITRDLIFTAGQSMPPAGTLPFTRYNFVKAKPGKAAELRRVWEKYNKPVMDKLVADGTVLAYGYSVEEVRTNGDFTHYVWYATKDLAGLEKVRSAFNADRDKRSQEEQDTITEAFAHVLDLDASRSEVERSVIFRLPNMK